MFPFHFLISLKGQHFKRFFGRKSGFFNALGSFGHFWQRIWCQTIISPTFLLKGMTAGRRGRRERNRERRGRQEDEKVLVYHVHCCWCTMYIIILILSAAPSCSYGSRPEPNRCWGQRFIVCLQSGVCGGGQQVWGQNTGFGFRRQVFELQLCTDKLCALEWVKLWDCFIISFQTERDVLDWGYFAGLLSGLDIIKVSSTAPDK